MNLTVNILSTDYSTLSQLSAGIGGISINGDSNLSASSSHSAEVIGQAVVSVNVAGYIGYSTTINDTGLEDASINIVLINDFEEGNTNYLRPYPTFFYFRELGSFTYTFYSGSSAVGNISFEVENAISRGSKVVHSFGSPGEYLIAITSASDYYTETVPSNNNTNLSVTEYRAELDIEVESSITYPDGTCFPSGALITVTPTITLIDPVDNSLYAATLTITNPKGFKIAELNFLAESIPSDIIFEVSEIGDYVIDLFLDDSENQNTYEEELTVKGCDSVVIKYSNCGSYSVFNYGNDDLAYSIDKDGLSGPLLPGEEVPITPSEGIVQVVVTYPDETTRVYLINNFCAIEKCMANYIEDVLCAPRDRCRPCPPDNELNQMVLFYNTYFMKVHALFYQNSFFDALSGENIADIVSIEALAAKMKAYCDNTEPGECCK